MNRMFGMMPRNEIEIERRYCTGPESDAKLAATIQAGKNGWTILFADHSSEYQDIVDTAENNFNKALNKLISYFTEITVIDKENTMPYIKQELRQNLDINLDNRKDCNYEMEK